MNLPKRPQDAHATLAAAFNTGDVNTVLNMYDYRHYCPGTSKIIVDHAFGAEASV